MGAGGHSDVSLSAMAQVSFHPRSTRRHKPCSWYHRVQGSWKKTPQTSTPAVPKANQAPATGLACQPAPGLLPDWNTYRARPCISSAGHVGGADSPVSLFRRKVNSKPKPLGPSVPVNLKGTKRKKFNYLQKNIV